jgi:hypothetical protein
MSRGIPENIVDVFGPINFIEIGATTVRATDDPSIQERP